MNINNLKILLCCIGRNENKYIREFIEHYYTLGVTNICLFDNNRDGEEHFEEVINDYISNGYVILKNYRNRNVCQLDAYNECYAEYNDKYDWIMFFDLDEFILLTNERYVNLQDYLSSDFLNDYDMIHVNWLIYGDNNNLYYENYPLTLRFSKPIDIDKKIAYDFPENCHIKSIIRGGLDNVKFTNSSHTILNNNIKCCNENGEEINGSLPFANISYKNIALQHFSTKTIDEYCDKMKRGFPDMNWDISLAKYLLETRFFKTNKVTKEKLDIILLKLNIDMSYLLTEDNKDEFIKIFSLCYEHKDFNFLNDKVITPLQVGAHNGIDVCNLKDNTGDNISHKNYFYIENTGIYWIWKNISGAKYKGQMQYRRPLEGINEYFNFDEAFKTYDVITCIPFNHPLNSKPTDSNPMFIPAQTVEEGYIFSNCKDDLDVLEMIINVYYPEYRESYKKYIKNGPNLYYSNGFIMRAEDYNRYCEFLF